MQVLGEIEHQSLPQLPQYEFVKFLGAYPHLPANVVVVVVVVVVSALRKAFANPIVGALGQQKARFQLSRRRSRNMSPTSLTTGWSGTRKPTTERRVQTRLTCMHSLSGVQYARACDRHRSAGHRADDCADQGGATDQAGAAGPPDQNRLLLRASSSKEGVDVVISPSYDRRKLCTKRRRAEPRRRKTRSGDERRTPPRPGDAVQRRAAKPPGPPPDKRARTMKMVRLALLLFNKTRASIPAHRKLLRCC